MRRSGGRWQAGPRGAAAVMVLLLLAGLAGCSLAGDDVDPRAGDGAGRRAGGDAIAVPDDAPIASVEVQALGAQIYEQILTRGKVWVLGDVSADPRAKDNTKVWVVEPESLDRVATIDLPVHSISLSEGDGALWSASESGGKVYVTRIDLATRETATTSAPAPSADGTIARAVYADGALWADRPFPSPSLVRIDPATAEVTDAIELPAQPVWQLERSPAGDLWAVFGGNDEGVISSMARIDLRAQTVTPIRAEAPVARIATADGGAWAVLRATGTLAEPNQLTDLGWVADGADAVELRASFDVEGAPGLAVDGDDVWVISAGERTVLARFDASAGRATALLQVDQGSGEILAPIQADEGALWGMTFEAEPPSASAPEGTVVSSLARIDLPELSRPPGQGPEET